MPLTKPKPSIDPNEELLKAIRSRKSKDTRFGRGILTADSYVKPFADMAGLSACYQYAATRETSFDDIIQKAAKTLVYSNDEMDLEERATSSVQFKGMLEGAGEGVELPKNTLMVFRHKLSTSMEDRDKDILRTRGMNLDPKMLLLWQHIHTMPLGPYLYTVSQDDKSVRVVSAIVDMNETTHDAAVMIDNGMGRFSHGFKAVEFEKRRNEKGEITGGFDIMKSDVMEESLVSVPANIGADTEDVLLSLVSSGKLTSPLMKSVAKTLRKGHPTQVQGIEVKYREKLGDCEREITCSSLGDLKSAVDAGLIGTKTEEEEGDEDENKSTDTGSLEGGTETSTDTSEETDGVDGEEGNLEEEQLSSDKEVDTVSEDTEDDIDTKGVYIDLPYSFEDISKKLRDLLEKSESSSIGMAATYPGRCIFQKYLNDNNEDKYYQIGWEMVDGACVLVGTSNEVNISAILSDSKSAYDLNEDNSLDDDGENEFESIDAKQAMAVFLEKASATERDHMCSLLEAFAVVDKRKQQTKQFQSIIKR